MEIDNMSTEQIEKYIEKRKKTDITCDIVEIRAESFKPILQTNFRSIDRASTYLFESNDYEKLPIGCSRYDYYGCNIGDRGVNIRRVKKGTFRDENDG